RNMYRNIGLLITFAAFAQSAFCGQFDWPQWQGPDRTAHSKETGLLKEWPKDGPPLAWKVKGLGGGDSMPSVAAGRIYGMSSDGAMLVALDKLTGDTIWKTKMPGGSGSAPGGSSNPSGGFGERDGGSAPGVTGTKDPNLFVSEHWGMTAFSQKVPNGKYVAKLYFAETYQGITGSG